MPRNADKTANVTMYISKEDYQRLREIAKRKGYRIFGDYVKSLLAADTGITISTDRGGYRAHESDKDDEQDEAGAEDTPAEDTPA